jgi:ASC-1-like (ASCH) protein
MLLAPGNSKGLAEIGKIYGDEYKKIDIKNYRGKMKKLAAEDKILFKEYAMRDALITLKHVNSMEEFNESLNKTGVPLTLSSISKAYVLKEWEGLGYKGYQMQNGYTFGSLTNLLTPKGINASGLTGLALNYYISSYKGGRNESFMFGVDRWGLDNSKELNRRMWVDYDLSGAYPTAMVFLGDPNYSLARLIDQK